MRLIIYDKTDKNFVGWTWVVGSWLYSLFNRVDARYGAISWADALDWVIRISENKEITEIQFWGHGSWGGAVINGDWLTSWWAQREPLNSRLLTVRNRLAKDFVWWFRTCNSFGAHKGMEFAKTFSNLIRRTVAAHTFIIWKFHSGLRVIRPTEEPSWPAEEGIKEGTPEKPEEALWSHPKAPHSIFFTTTTIPEKILKKE